MYSPFIDKKGRPLDIIKIRYEHLEQLKDCDEGHHLEYKLLLEDGGKAQLAKEITSFANCEGGWLIVGIDDKSKEVRPIPKADYSQKIGKIATRISPLPEFETRFIAMPDDKNNGVLLIYIYEGKHAPYVCNGSVYIRSGSSKEPIKTAERGNIEYLLNRSQYHQNELNNFFKRDFFFSYNDISRQKVTYPIANVYIKNISSIKNNYLFTYVNRDKIIDFVFSSSKIFKSVDYSMNSIIFKNTEVYPSNNSGTLIFELFYDWSCKIYMPIGITSYNDELYYKNFYRSMEIDDDIVDKLRISSGDDICGCLMGGIQLFCDIAQKYDLREKDYAVCVELENIAEAILGFHGDKYKDYIIKYGLPYANKEVNKSKTIFLREYTNQRFDDLINYIISDIIGSAFGFRSDSVYEILFDSIKRYEDYRKQ